MRVKDWKDKIVEQYGQEYVLRQLAEESAELCQAALKAVRLLHGETPVAMTEAQDRMLEEIADVEIMIDVLKDAVLNDRGVARIREIGARKKERMIGRMLEVEA